MTATCERCTLPRRCAGSQSFCRRFRCIRHRDERKNECAYCAKSRDERASRESAATDRAPHQRGRRACPDPPAVPSLLVLSECRFGLLNAANMRSYSGFVLFDGILQGGLVSSEL